MTTIGELVNYGNARKAQTWGGALLRARMGRDLSHRELAERCGVTAKDIAAWERDEGRPQGARLARLYGSLAEMRAYRHLLPQEVNAHPEVVKAEAAAVPLDNAEQEDVRALLEKPEARPRTFGEGLRRARTRAGLSQLELGELVGVGHSPPSTWELNNSVPILAHYQKLVELLPELKDCPRPRGIRDMEKPGREPGQEALTVAIDASIPPIEAIEASRGPAPQLALPPISDVEQLGAAHARALVRLAQVKAAHKAVVEEAMRLAEEVHAAALAATQAEEELRRAAGA
jgi:transcriptional regulator with XRE-family HTH domain